MSPMQRARVRDPQLKTSALIQEVAQERTYIIESRGIKVAELRPIAAQRVGKPLPDREAWII